MEAKIYKKLRPVPILADGRGFMRHGGGEKLWLEAYRTYPDESVCRGPRTGINYAKLKDRQIPWRF
jgi:hypothetical protein